MPNKKPSKKSEGEPRPYNLTFEDVGGYLLARVAGRVMTAEEKGAYLNEIAKKCAEIKCKGVLIERKIQENVPTGSLYPIAVATQKAFGKTKIAFAVTGGHSLEFFKAAYKSVGGDCAVFESIPEAEYWLRADQEL